MEGSPLSTAAPPSCFNCNKLQTDLSKPLKRCAKCQTAFYCSRTCQMTNWKIHKPTCHLSSTSPPTNPPQKFDPLPNPPQEPDDGYTPGFHAFNHMFGLSNDDLLHNRPEREVFNLLIDSFRMRVEDEYVFGGNTTSIYNEDKPLPLFKKFLSLAESRQQLLPAWWSPAKRRECERLSVHASQWSDINRAVEKSDIQDHYNDNMMPMKLRILGEKIYGKGFM
ncbi:Ankyrin repeat and MYND domain-containing protein 2 [Pseudogymnoascus australis]